MVKETSKKSTVKKTTTKKESIKKVKEEAVETKTQVKKIKKDNKFINILKMIGGKLKKFFNDPRPIITILCLLCALLIWSFANYKSKYKMYIGSVTKGDITISNVQVDMNPKVNSFMSSVANYSGDAVKVYNYEIGYYYKVNGEFKKFAGSSSSVSNGIDLSELLTQASYIQVLEMTQNETNFTKEAKNHMEDLYFIVRGTTTADAEDYDLNYEIDLNLVDMNE